MKPVKRPGARKAKYRTEVEARLNAMGFKSHRYRWQASPSRLVVVVDDAMRDYALHAGQSKAKTEYELGRLDTWAEVLNLKPLPVRQWEQAVKVYRANESATVLPAKANGAVHVGG